MPSDKPGRSPCDTPGQQWVYPPCRESSARAPDNNWRRTLGRRIFQPIRQRRSARSEADTWSEVFLPDRYCSRIRCAAKAVWTGPPDPADESDPGLLAGLTKTVYGDGLLLAADYMHAIMVEIEYSFQYTKGRGHWCFLLS